jgi:hypothetical protein
MKEILKQEYTKTLRMLLNCDMNARNEIAAIQSLAVSVLRYNFDIINWRFDEIRKIDRKTTEILTMCKIIILKVIYIYICVYICIYTYI